MVFYVVYITCYDVLKTSYQITTQPTVFLLVLRISSFYYETRFAGLVFTVCSYGKQKLRDLNRFLPKLVEYPRSQISGQSSDHFQVHIGMTCTCPNCIVAARSFGLIIQQHMPTEKINTIHIADLVSQKVTSYNYLFYMFIFSSDGSRICM